MVYTPLFFMITYPTILDASCAQQGIGGAGGLQDISSLFALTECLDVWRG